MDRLASRFEESEAARAEFAWARNRTLRAREAKVSTNNLVFIRCSILPGR
jgi:hypothetical protein